ncbi:MAG: hypothetical protein J6R50_01995 [Alistipes sp.]|nr:hypothetical protein [Alistipes sp.]
MFAIVRVVLLLVAVFIPLGVWAQQEEDYLQYKFYDEDKTEAETDMLWWLSDDADSLRFHSTTMAHQRYSSLGYAMRFVRYAPRGEERAEERYLVNHLDVGYSTGRLLAALGLERALGGVSVTPGVGGESTLYNIAATSRNVGHRVRGDLSGRNYLGSLGWRGVYAISPRGVELDDDWLLRSYVRLNGGSDLYIEGVGGNAVDVAMSAQREWRNDRLFVAIMLPWSKRSVRQYSVDEAYQLTQNRYYNPAWGMQSGEMRSSRINSSLRPELLAAWSRRLGAWTDLSVTMRGVVERTGRTSLAWYDAQTPMPDNYRYLPSFFERDDEARPVTEAWSYNNLKYTQIDWDDLYHTNSLQSDGHAAYAVESRRSNAMKYNAVVDFTTQLRGFDIEYGVAINLDSRRMFKAVDDLLGADYLLDIDYFIRDDATYGTRYRNNLRGEQLEVREGDHFGYDYRLSRWQLGLFGLARWSIGSMNFEVAATLGHEGSRRRGYFEKELFAGKRSFGPSAVAKFFPSSLSVKWDYMVGCHGFNACVVARGSAPRDEDIFLQPDYNNRLASGLKSEFAFATEVGYSYLRSNLRLAAKLFVVHHSSEQKVVRYYDDFAEEYVDAVIADIERLNLGAELNAWVRWTSYMSSQFSLTAGRFRYSGDAAVEIYADNDNDLVAETTARMRGLRSGYPEVTAYGDVMFQRAGWRAKATIQYWGLRHVTPSFVRRTERVMGYAPSLEELSALEYQERLGDAVTLGLSVGKSFDIGEKLWLNVSLSVDNILNSSIISGGYEQNRVRRTSGGYYTSLRPFAGRVSYAYGRLFRLNVSLGF